VGKVFQGNEPHKQAGVVISDRVDFRLKLGRRDNEGHFILNKGSIHQEEISILNTYLLNIWYPTTFLKKPNRLFFRRPQHSDSGITKSPTIINR
jgi:hypothetical protein